MKYLDENGLQIINEEETFEQLWDEIYEIKELLESIYNQNFVIMQTQNTIINKDSKVQDDKIAF